MFGILDKKYLEVEAPEDEEHEDRHQHPGDHSRHRAHLTGSSIIITLN